jgi:hypothetical protein
MRVRVRDKDLLNQLNYPVTLTRTTSLFQPQGDKYLLEAIQEIGDGKIELMTIKALKCYSKAQLGILRGCAKRVCQSRGPVSPEFEEKYDKKIYFQIDGENFACTSPKEFRVTHAKVSVRVRVRGWVKIMLVLVLKSSVLLMPRLGLDLWLGLG